MLTAKMMTKKRAQFRRYASRFSGIQLSRSVRGLGGGKVVSIWYKGNMMQLSFRSGRIVFHVFDRDEAVWNALTHEWRHCESVVLVGRNLTGLHRAHFMLTKRPYMRSLAATSRHGLRKVEAFFAATLKALSES
jgi:hypothetical protein